jgi:acyl-CoA reductase-like NAD-dependent aldehyde dehydrogenase
VVVKPGEQAPLTVLRLAELANEILPPGVLNAVPGLAAGPALSAQRDKVLAYLRTGLDEGARLVTQGTLPAQERLKDGYWVAPTIPCRSGRP